MSSKPFLNFANKDWLTDPKLRRCSPAARALWIDLCCFSCLEEPFGYVTVDGEPMDAEAIRDVIGGWPSVEVVAAALAELEKRDVFSRDRHGRIYSRRIVRDVKAAKTARENGRKGGNPRLKADPASHGNDNGISIRVNPPTHARGGAQRAPSGNGNGNGKIENPVRDTIQKEPLVASRFDPADAQKPPAELAEAPPEFEFDQSDGRQLRSAAQRQTASLFDKFWRLYPHKVGKADAKKKFATALAKVRDADILFAGIERYMASKPPDRQWANPATWLNQERWLDEPSHPPQRVNGRAPFVDDEEARQRRGLAALDRYAREAAGHG